MNADKVQSTGIKWLNAIQFLSNYAAVAVASLAGGYLEMLAHVRAENGYEMGIGFSFVSIAALTVAALTKDKWAWAFYALQLVIGLSQMPTVPLGLLSLSSLPAAYAAGKMMSFSFESQQQDKTADREHEKEMRKIDNQHDEKMARINKKGDSQSSNRISDSPDWNQADNMRANGSSLRDIATALGISYGKVQRHFSKQNDSNESPGESVIHLNGTGG